MALTFGVEIEIFLDKTPNALKKLIKNIVHCDSFDAYLEQYENMYSVYNTKLSAYEIVEKIDDILLDLDNSKSIEDKTNELLELLSNNISSQDSAIIFLLIIQFLCDSENKKKRKLSTRSTSGTAGKDIKYQLNVYSQINNNIVTITQPQQFIVSTCRTIKHDNAYVWTLDYDSSVIFRDITSKIVKDKEICYSEIKDKGIEKKAKDIIPYIEFVSGILNSADEVKYSCKKLFKDLKKLSSSCNSVQTSNHIHFALKDGKFIDNPVLVFSLCYVTYMFQPLIHALCRPERKNSKYCKPLELSFNDKDTINNLLHVNLYKLDNNQDSKFLTFDSYNRTDKMKLISKMFHAKDTNNYHPDTNEYIVDKYMLLNLKNICFDTIPTIELRIKHGSNSYQEISCFCHLIGGLYKIAFEMANIVYKHASVHECFTNCVNTKTLEDNNLAINMLIKKNDVRTFLKNQLM